MDTLKLELPYSHSGQFIVVVIERLQEVIIVLVGYASTLENIINDVLSVTNSVSCSIPIGNPFV